MRLITFITGTDWSPTEKRLLAMAPNPEAQKPPVDTKKQEQGPQVPYIPLKGENPQKFIEFISNAPQYLQSVKTSEYWRDKVREMEQWLYSTNAGGKDRAGQNEHVIQRNSWLRQHNAGYTIFQKLDAKDPHDRDIIKINFPENKESPQLMALKQKRASLRQQIKEVDGRIRGTEFRGNRSRTPRYDSMHTQEDMQELKRLKAELAIVEQQIANPPKAPPAAPVLAGAMPQDPRFGSQLAPESRFDLDQKLQRIQPPEVADKIRQMPQQLQGPVVRVYENLPAGSQQMLIGLLNGFTRLAPNVQQNVWTLISGENPAIVPLPEAQQFILFLSPEQRSLFDQIAGESRMMQEQREVLTGANLQKVQRLIKNYNEAKTDNDRQIAEGTMRMLGVDVDATNFDPNNVQMLPKDGLTRFISAFMGLLQVITALAGKSGIGDKEGNVIRKTKEAAKKKADTEKMTPEERTKKKKELHCKVSSQQQ